jgi:RecA/RadA recombinase
MGNNVVTLSTGQEIELCYIPSGLRDVINRRYPMPDAPIVETVTATGQTLKMAIEDDPGYLAERAKVEAQRNQAWNEAYTLAALKNVAVPDDFDMEAEWGEELRYLDPDWEPRTGKMGQKLDYIEFVLCANVNDMSVISDKINKMMGIDTEVIESIEDSFRSDIQEEAD